MQLSPALQAFGSMCLLLAHGFPVSDYDSPEIIGAHHVQIKAHLGQHLILHCEAFANCEADQTLIYWLVNGSFPEDTHSSSRMVETEGSTLEEGAILQRSLLLKNITSEDFKSTFTCVVENAMGTAKKQMTLAPKSCVCTMGKHRKHRGLPQQKL